MSNRSLQLSKARVKGRVRMVNFNKTTQEKHERQISAAQQGSGKGKGEDGKSKNSNWKRTNSAMLDDGKIAAHQYTRAEWFKLTPEQRKKIKELRASKQSHPGNKKGDGFPCRYNLFSA